MSVYFKVVVAVHTLRPKHVCWGFTRRHWQQQPRRLRSLPIFTLTQKTSLDPESLGMVILGLWHWLSHIAQTKRLEKRSFLQSRYTAAKSCWTCSISPCEVRQQPKCWDYIYMVNTQHKQSISYLKPWLENKPGLQSRALDIRTYLSNPGGKHGQILTRVLRFFSLLRG